MSTDKGEFRGLQAVYNEFAKKAGFVISTDEYALPYTYRQRDFSNMWLRFETVSVGGKVKASVTVRGMAEHMDRRSGRTPIALSLTRDIDLAASISDEVDRVKRDWNAYLNEVSEVIPSVAFADVAGGV